jgi:tRNA dimethylallyltransferase
MTGHGYREAAAHLTGEIDLDTAIAITARHTRQYAKRQLSWFRRDRRIRWLAAEHVAMADLATGVVAAHRAEVG